MGGEVSWRLKDVDRNQVSREGGTLSLSAFSSSLLWNSFSLLDRGEEICCSHGHKACVLHSLSHTHTHTHPLSLSLSFSHTHAHTHLSLAALFAFLLSGGRPPVSTTEERTCFTVFVVSTTFIFFGGGASSSSFGAPASVFVDGPSPSFRGTPSSPVGGDSVLPSLVGSAAVDWQYTG